MTTETDRPVNENPTTRHLMVINARSVEASAGRYLDIENPAHRTVIGEVPRATGADVDTAVRAAAAAFETWRLVAPRERGRLLSRIADAVEAEVESIARTVALETGNAIRTQARPEVKSAVDVLRYFGGVASELKGETVPLGEHVLSYTRREPIGVVGGHRAVERPGGARHAEDRDVGGRGQHAGAEGGRGRAARPAARRAAVQRAPAGGRRRIC